MRQTTASDVAYWMLLELERRGGRLDEEFALSRVTDVFGPEFTSQDVRGNWALNRSVLDAFDRLTAGTVVWNEQERAWQYHDEGGGSRVV